MPKIAVIQESPLILSREGSLQKAVGIVEEVVKEGAQLIVFPESFIPGYPAWIWRLRPGDDGKLTERIHALLLSNSVDLKNNDLSLLCDAAKKQKVTIVCGISERESDLSRSTLYNTVVIIGPEGEILNRHRKLMPTNPERMVWGFGDGSGLKVVDTPCGRVGTLVCWENYMLLARYALYCQGIEIYIAPTYDSGEKWICTLRHIAREGRCWVVGSGTALHTSDFSDDFPAKEKIFPDQDEWINPGDSIVIAPGGKVITAGPMHKEKGILYAEVDSESVGVAKRDMDIVGHYARPDIFTLKVNTMPQSPVEFTQDTEE